MTQQLSRAFTHLVIPAEIWLCRAVPVEEVCGKVHTSCADISSSAEKCTPSISSSYLKSAEPPAADASIGVPS